jgi:hypothetical protein
MVTQTQQIDWTLKTQNLFDLHAPEAYVENASKTTRFSFVEQDDLDSSWTVLLHEEGEKNFELPQQKGFTVNWDLISTTITIYALPLRKKPSQTPTDSVKHEGRFSEWTTGGKRNQPGFSVDPIILASDIAITTELYNEMTFPQPVGFSRAEKFKKVYKSVYKGPITAQSVAFVLAFRLDNFQAVTPRMLGEQLVEEYHRRLWRYNEMETNEYYVDSEIDDWKERYEGIVQLAIQYINDENQNVADEIERRKSRNVPFTRPRVESTVLGILQDKGKKKKKSPREEFILPMAIQTVLKKLQDQPLIRRNGFRDLMIKQGGNLHQTLKTEESGFTNGKIQEWNLHGKWIESATSVIWNLTEELVKKYTFSEDLVHSIEDYHFERFGS